MTVYALTDLASGEVEVRYEMFDQPAPEPRNGKIWLVDNGPGNYDHLQYTVEVDAPIAGGVTVLPYRLVPHTPAMLREFKARDIAAIESTITPRRLREAVLSQAGADWLAAKEAEIAAVRATL